MTLIIKLYTLIQLSKNIILTSISLLCVEEVSDELNGYVQNFNNITYYYCKVPSYDIQFKANLGTDNNVQDIDYSGAIKYIKEN